MREQKIRWGILGTGKIAGEFAAALRALPDAELAAVGSRSTTTAERFAAAHGVAKAYGSYRELVQDSEIDVVYIATPHVTHKEHCLLCLEAGKAILCEKPFALNAAEAAEVIAVARAKQLFCMEAMWMRFLPAVREAHRLVQSNAIGDVRVMQASLGFLMEYDPEHRAFNRALGGGALLDLGVYALSLIIQFLGKPSSITSHANIGETGVDEQGAVILGYDAGKLAVVTSSLRTYNANDALIMGSAGQIHLHEPLYRPESLSVQQHTIVVGAQSTEDAATTPTAKARLKAQLRDVALVRKLYQRLRPLVAPLLGLQKRQIHLPAKGNGYGYEAEEVMNCLRQGRTESTVMPLDETLLVMETMDAIRAQWDLHYPQEQIRTA